MFSIKRIGTLAMLLGCSLLAAQDDEKEKSGPKAGTSIPGPFECFNVNGPAKGRPHCLVCKFALSPSVLIFAKVPENGKDEAFTELLTKLDETAADFEERNFSVGVVILSPDARDSTNNADEKDAKAIIEEALKREKLLAELTKRAETLKHVIIAYHSTPGPKAFKLNPKVEMTVLFYERMKILENYSYSPEALQSKDVEKMVKRVRDELPLQKKGAGAKKS